MRSVVKQEEFEKVFRHVKEGCVHFPPFFHHILHPILILDMMCRYVIYIYIYIYIYIGSYFFFGFFLHFPFVVCALVSLLSHLRPMYLQEPRRLCGMSNVRWTSGWIYLKPFQRMDGCIYL